MSLFSKTEVNPKMIPFIQNAEGVGIVKLKGYGKVSARMESYKIIFDSYEGKNPIIESVSAITYLSYKKGNFINEPKLEIGISHKKYILSGVDNNDEELESFYRTILDIKNLEQEQKQSSYNQMSQQPIDDFDELAELDKITDSDNDSVEFINNENIDLETELLKDDLDEDTFIETKDDTDNQSENNIDKPADDDADDDFELLEELDEKDAADILEEESVVQEQQEAEENQVEEVSEIEDDELLEDEELVDEILEIDDEQEQEEDRILPDNQNTVEDKQLEESEDSENLTDTDEEEDYDEDFDVFDDEGIIFESDEDDETDSDRILVESDEAQNNNLNSEIVEDQITTNNITSEIGKMKQQLFDGINNIQNDLTPEKNNSQYSSNVQLDPVDQIRRYHELKEDGIITEEEFEQKKKQLLNL